MGGFGHNISSSTTCRARPRMTISRRFVPVPFSGERRACLRLLWSVNLPGWRWATIKQVALDRLSRSLHSDVCDSDGCCDAVLHSTISGRGSRRARAAPNISFKSISRQPSFDLVLSVRLGPARFSDWRAGGLGGGSQSYLLGLLAMIKCSICSYQCDN